MNCVDSMTMEPPGHISLLASWTQRDPGSRAPNFNSCYLSNTWPQSRLRCNSPPNQMISMYKKDFQPWPLVKRQPFRMKDSLKVSQGIGVCPRDPVQKSRGPADLEVVPQVQARQPFHSVTSYREHYVPHPLQPRASKTKTAWQSSQLLAMEPAVSYRPQGSCGRELLDKASELLQQFENWSFETSPSSQGNNSRTPGEKKILVMCENRPQGTCQQNKVVLLSVQTSERNKAPFQGATTMKEDCKVWDTEQHLPLEETGTSRETARNCEPLLKSSRSIPIANKTATRKTGGNATDRRPRPAGKNHIAYNPSQARRKK